MDERRPGPPGQAHRRREPAPVVPPVHELWPPAATPPAGRADPDGAAGGAEPGRMVRPYALTGGRTRPTGVALALEAMVLATPAGRAAQAGLTWERRAIVQLCATPLSVAEVSAHLGLPLGVARVLVSDLAAEDLLSVHGGSGPTGTDTLPLLERVLQGLRAL